MLSNIWKGLSFYCMNGHERPVLMSFKEGSSLPADSQHPDGHARHEAACANRLSFSDAEKIVSMLSDAVQDSLCRDDLCDFTGYRFRLRQIAVTVLKYSDGDIRLGILNRGAVDR